MQGRRGGGGGRWGEETNRLVTPTGRGGVIRMNHGAAAWETFHFVTGQALRSGVLFFGLGYEAVGQEQAHLWNAHYSLSEHLRQLRAVAVIGEGSILSGAGGLIHGNDHFGGGSGSGSGSSSLGGGYHESGTSSSKVSDQVTGAGSLAFGGVAKGLALGTLPLSLPMSHSTRIAVRLMFIVPLGGGQDIHARTMGTMQRAGHT